MTSGRGQAKEIFCPVLTKLGADPVSHFGAAEVRLVPAGVQERPFSQVMRLGVYPNGADEPASHIFVKVFKPKSIDGGMDAMRRRVAADYATTRRVYASMLPWSNLGAVRPVACFPEHLAIVTEEAAGSTLLAHLQAEAAWFPAVERLSRLHDTMRTVGHWIRVFQTLDGETGRVTIDSVRQYVDVRLERLARHAGTQFTEHDRARVLDHIDFLGAHIGPEDLREVMVHSDLSLGNILVSGNRVVVLDFAMTKGGTRLHDLTRVYLQVALLGVKPAFRMPVVRGLQRALLEGFDPALTPDHPLFRLMLLLHRINNLGTLSIDRAPLLQGIYNRLVCRQHRRWITVETEGGAAGAERR